MAALKKLIKQSFFAASKYGGINWLARKALGHTNVLVLCYHGVVSDDHAPGDLTYRNTVSARQFDWQLGYLNKNFRPISASDLIDAFHGIRQLPADPVLVTFDDGYRNNLTHAAPLLLRHGVPAMVNVTTEYIGRKAVLWPDEVNLRVIGWQQATIPIPSGDSSTRERTVSADPQCRMPLAEEIRALCKTLPEQRLNAYLEKLRAFPSSKLEERDFELFDFLSWDEVRKLSTSGFEIGSHTVSHPILTQIPAKKLDHELRESKRQIESETGAKCRCLVYPNGQAADFSPTVMNAVEAAGYDLAFSATGEFASLKGEKFALSRIGVPGHQPNSVFESRVSGLHTWLKGKL